MHSSQPISSSGIKAIILMAGTGERFGSSTPKQFHRLGGKKVYLHTLEVFLSSQLFDAITLVCPALWVDSVEKDIAIYQNMAISVIIGGQTRQESTFIGLRSCPSDTQIVVIHDAVRPFVSHQILRDNIAKAIEHGAVDTCTPSADTLVYAPEKNHISTIPNRADYLRGQTPQSFFYPLILNAHQKAEQLEISNSSDDCSLVLQSGHRVHIVLGSEENIKITSELDLFLAEQLLRLRHISCPSIEEKVSLKGKRIAITGGTGGIGQALCGLLEEEGASPIILSKSSKDYPVDLTSYAAVSKAFDKILLDHGPLDGLVNSFGQLITKPLDQLSSAEIDSLIATNLTGVIYCCKCAHLKKGAHIVNIASSSYSRGRKSYAIYASAKAAVVNFTQGLAEEREDLFINTLVPQRTHTSMRTDNFPGEEPSTLLQPKEVAKEILNLLKQRTLTGSVIDVKKSLSKFTEHSSSEQKDSN